MRAVGRLIVSLVGFMVAAIAAGLFIVLARQGRVPNELVDAVVYWERFAIGLGLATSLVATAALVPAFVAIAVAEVFRLRTVVYYIGVGAVLSAAGIFGLSARLDPTASDPRRTTLLLAAGIVGGAVYWVIAGRTAGLADPRANPPDAPPGDRPAPR